MPPVRLGRAAPATAARTVPARKAAAPVDRADKAERLEAVDPAPAAPARETDPAAHVALAVLAGPVPLVARSVAQAGAARAVQAVPAAARVVQAAPGLIGWVRVRIAPSADRGPAQLEAAAVRNALAVAGPIAQEAARATARPAPGRIALNAVLARTAAGRNVPGVVGRSAAIVADRNAPAVASWNGPIGADRNVPGAAGRSGPKADTAVIAAAGRSARGAEHEREGRARAASAPMARVPADTVQTARARAGLVPAVAAMIGPARRARSAPGATVRARRGVAARTVVGSATAGAALPAPVATALVPADAVPPSANRVRIGLR